MRTWGATCCRRVSSVACSPVTVVGLVSRWIIVLSAWNQQTAISNRTFGLHLKMLLLGFWFCNLSFYLQRSKSMALSWEPMEEADSLAGEVASRITCQLAHTKAMSGTFTSWPHSPVDAQCSTSWWHERLCEPIKRWFVSHPRGTTTGAEKDTSGAIPVHRWGALQLVLSSWKPPLNLHALQGSRSQAMGSRVRHGLRL